MSRLCPWWHQRAPSNLPAVGHQDRPWIHPVCQPWQCPRQQQRGMRQKGAMGAWSKQKTTMMSKVSPCVNQSISQPASQVGRHVLCKQTHSQPSTMAVHPFIHPSLACSYLHVGIFSKKEVMWWFVWIRSEISKRKFVSSKKRRKKWGKGSGKMPLFWKIQWCIPLYNLVQYIHGQTGGELLEVYSSGTRWYNLHACMCEPVKNRTLHVMFIREWS